MNASLFRNLEYDFPMSKIKGLEGGLATCDTKRWVWFLSDACDMLFFLSELSYRILEMIR